MRQTLRSSFQPSSRSVSIPAPIGGWNARDPLAVMSPSDAVMLDNFFPRTGDVMLREGSSLFATLPADIDASSPHNVRALLPYKSPAGTAKLFAAADDGLYDVTAGGTVSSIASAATNASWQFVNITTAGGSFLWCCNGVDKSRYFDGTNWTILDTPALTGIASADITNVCLFKSRLFFTQKNSLSYWYLPVNSISGAAIEFPLGALFRRGGYLMAVNSWTLDGGNGPDDYFIAVTSEGEVAVYKGTDPSSATAWGLQGVYYIGKPLSRRCLTKLGGDLLVLTVQGLYPLSKALMSATVDARSAISDKISQAWIDYTSQYSSLYGWQMTFFPEATMLLVNVPIVSRHDLNSVYSYQFVMNTQTGAWCRFNGWSAEVLETYEGGLYFALHNKVYRAWTGNSDANGSVVEGLAKTAYSYPVGRGTIGQVKQIRPIVTAPSTVSVDLGIDVDYSSSDLPTASNISYNPNPTGRWDSAHWDNFYWAASSTTQAKWTSVNSRPGRAMSVRLRVRAKDINMTWIATDLIVQKGGMV